MLRTIAVVLSMDDAAFAARMKADGVLLDEFAAKSEKSSVVIQSAARNNVDARMKEQGSLVSLRDTYIAMSDAAVKGSAEQVTAAKLAAEANAKLAASGLEVKAGTSAANDALGLLSGLGVKVGGSGQIASTALKGIAADAGAMSVGVTAGVAAAVIGFGVLAAAGISSYMRLGDQTRILQGVTGATAEDASKLIFTFNQIGTNADTLTLSFARFGKNINDLPQRFDSLGVSIAHTNTGAADVFGTFENLKKTFDATGDAATRDAIVMDLLGRGASGLIPYLRLSAEELKNFNAEAESLGVVMSGADVEATRQFGIATKELHSSLSALGIMVGREVLPTLTFLAQAGVTGFKVIGDASSAVGSTVDKVSLLSRGLHDLKNGALILATSGLAAIPLALHKSTSETEQNDVAVQALTKGYAAMGVTLSDADAAQIIASKSQTQLAQAVDSFKTKMDETASSVGLSVTGLTADINVFGAVAPEDFAKVEAAASAMAAAVNAGVQAASGAFAKDTNAVSYFSASSIASRESAAASAAKSANGIVTADNRVSDAEQHVADLTEQFADQSATAKQDYADKVEANNQKVADSEQSLADTIDSTSQRVTDASSNLADTIQSNDQKVRDADQKLADDRISAAQSVADAQKRLEDDRRSGAQSVADAQQKLADDEQLLALRRNPAAQQRLRDQFQIRDAHEAVSRAQEAAASKEQSDLDAIGKAQENQIKILAADQAAADKARIDQIKAVEKAQDELDKARVEQSRSVQKAEEAVAKARAEQNKLAVEGLTVGQETRQQQVEMRKAIEAVGTAQRAVAADAIKSTGAVSDAIGVTVDDVKKFYDDSTREAQTFEAGIHEAIAKGYDPQFIADILKEGPHDAAPIIQAIVNDHDGTLRNIVNSGQKAIEDLSQQNIEVAHATFVATTSQNAQTRAEFHNAMAIIEQEGADGGRLTADALAHNLSLRVGDVEQIARDYGIKLADGINPVLDGIGVNSINYDPGKPLTYDPSSYTYRAEGGQVPGGYGTKDDVPAMLTKGEIVFSVPAVQKLGAENLLHLHEMARKGFAAGGFVTASDVPPVPDYSAYGTALGYGADAADQYARAKVIAYLSGGLPGGTGRPSIRPSGQVADWVAAGVELAGRPAWWVSPEVNIAMFESGGDPNAINLWDSNAAAGTPSKGLMQCVPLDSEILTRDGWKAHDEVQVGDETLGFNPATGRSEWTPVTKVVHYEGAPVVRIGNRFWSARVTANHRWWSEPKQERTQRGTTCPECGSEWPTERGMETHLGKRHKMRLPVEHGFGGRFVRTEEFQTNDRLRLAAPATTDGIPCLSLEDIRVLSWLQGDGHIRPAKEGGWDGTIYQSKPAMVVKLRELLASVPHSELVRQREGNCLPSFTFNLRRTYVTDLIKRTQIMEVGPEAFVLALSPEQRAAWLGSMIDAEGNRQLGPTQTNEFVRIAQKDGPIQDAIALAVFLEGYRPSFSRFKRTKDHHSPAGIVGMCAPHVVPAMFNPPEHAGTETVWCVKTDLETWTMRQSGRIMITGNTIDPTFRAYMVPNHGDIWNPVDNVAAASNYIAARYGDPSQTPGERSLARGGSYQGYEFGGLVEALGGLHVASHDNGGYLEPGWNLGWNGTGTREPVGVTAAGPGIDYDRLGKAIASALAPMVGGDINVSNVIQGSVLGSHQELAERIAEPLRVISKDRSRGISGSYFS